jgi:hypothetical protein
MGIETGCLQNKLRGFERSSSDDRPAGRPDGIDQSDYEIWTVKRQTSNAGRFLKKIKIVGIAFQGVLFVVRVEIVDTRETDKRVPLIRHAAVID